MSTNENLSQKFLNLVSEACAEIGEQYFALSQSNQQSRYRERVYAYELYHILRGKLENDVEFEGLSLNGEVDKAGRLDFSNEKPDLLLHYPGTMDRNIAIMEIKRCNGVGFQQAVENLETFTTKYGYAGGIFLIFGDQKFSQPAMPKRCRLIWHCRPGVPGEIF